MQWIIDNFSEFTIVIRIIQICAILVAICSLFVAYRAYRINTSLVRGHRTLEYSLTRNASYQAARMSIGKKFKEEIKNGTEIELPRILNDEQMVQQVDFLLAHWEIMAISIDRNLISEEIAFSMVGGTLVKFVDSLQLYIIDAQKLNSRRYTNLNKLAKRWEKILDNLKNSTNKNKIYTIRTANPGILSSDLTLKP